MVDSPSGTYSSVSCKRAHVRFRFAAAAAAVVRTAAAAAAAAVVRTAAAIVGVAAVGCCCWTTIYVPGTAYVPCSCCF